MSPVLADAAVQNPIEFVVRFERRGSERLETLGWAMACFREADAPPRLVSLRLADISTGGLGVFTDRPFAPGTPFDLFSPGSSQPTRFGEVARCTPAGPGAWRLGLAFGRAALAA